mmetsp:Transcript_100743/g.325129  ORF Transcript_100743/g.325129 Transcript_100743/m.325129 type:complete len:222 (-) Transcript_100743:163-828(-)
MSAVTGLDPPEATRPPATTMAERFFRPPSQRPSSTDWPERATAPRSPRAETGPSPRALPHALPVLAATRGEMRWAGCALSTATATGRSEPSAATSPFEDGRLPKSNHMTPGAPSCTLDFSNFRSWRACAAASARALLRCSSAALCSSWARSRALTASPPGCLSLPFRAVHFEGRPWRSAWFRAFACAAISRLRWKSSTSSDGRRCGSRRALRGSDSPASRR